MGQVPKKAELPLHATAGARAALIPSPKEHLSCVGWWIIYSLLMRKGNGECGKWGENKYVFIKNGKS